MDYLIQVGKEGIQFNPNALTWYNNETHSLMVMSPGGAIIEMQLGAAIAIEHEDGGVIHVYHNRELALEFYGIEDKVVHHHAFPQNP